MSTLAPCSLATLGIVNALGRGVDEVWPRLLAGDASAIAQRDDLVPGRRLWLGSVDGERQAVVAAGVALEALARDSNHFFQQCVGRVG